MVLVCKGDSGMNETHIRLCMLISSTKMQDLSNQGARHIGEVMIDFKE